MNRYLQIKVFSFVPKVDLTFIIGHRSDNILYYELLQPITIRYKHKYNANIRIQIGFWVANIQFKFFVFVSALYLVGYMVFIWTIVGRLSDRQVLVNTQNRTHTIKNV